MGKSPSDPLDPTARTKHGCVPETLALSCGHFPSTPPASFLSLALYSSSPLPDPVELLSIPSPSSPPAAAPVLSRSNPSPPRPPSPFSAVDVRAQGLRLTRPRHCLLGGVALLGVRLHGAEGRAAAAKRVSLRGAAPATCYPAPAPTPALLHPPLPPRRRRQGRPRPPGLGSRRGVRCQGPCRLRVLRQGSRTSSPHPPRSELAPPSAVGRHVAVSARGAHQVAGHDHALRGRQQDLLHRRGFRAGCSKLMDISASAGSASAS